MKSENKLAKPQMNKLPLSCLLNRGSPKTYKFRPFLGGKKYFCKHKFHLSIFTTHRYGPQKLEDDPQTPQQDVFTLTFKVFNNQHKEAESQHLKRDQAKYKMQATAIQGSHKYQPPPWTMALRHSRPMLQV